LDSGPISFPLFNEPGLPSVDQQLPTPKSSISGPDSFLFDSPLGVARENTSKVTEFPKEGWPRSLALSTGMSPPQPLQQAMPAQQPQIAPASVYATNDYSQVQPAAAPGQQVMPQQTMDSQYGAYYQGMIQPASDSQLQYQQMQMQQQQQPMQAYSTQDQSVPGDVSSKRPRLYEDSTPSAYAQVPAQIPPQQVFMPPPHPQAAVQMSQQVPQQPQSIVVDQLTPRARPQYSDDDEAYEMDELDDEEADSVDSGSKRDKKRKSPSKSSPQSNEPIPDPMMDDGEDSESDFDEADENVKQLERLNPERVLVMQRELGASIGQSLMELMSGPAKHQVKEFNILPINVLRLNYRPQCADFIVINLLCGRKMRRRESLIFLTAVSAKRVAEENSSDVVVHNLKISKDMIQGRTKGFKFYLLYTLISGGERVCTLRSKSFYLWSNINQQGFPRQQRDKYLADKKLIIKGRRKR
jgi:hypothetical protein